MAKGQLIGGVRFRHGEVDWEGTRTTFREALPDFQKLRDGLVYSGSKHTTVGLVAKIGRYILVITEQDEDGFEYDYTLIPAKAKTAVHYHD
jgi:hypothetical protein